LAISIFKFSKERASVEFVVLREVDEPTLKRLRELVESLGPPPIDLVIVGAEETRLEIGDVYALKVSLPLDSYKVVAGGGRGPRPDGSPADGDMGDPSRRQTGGARL
jgi:hypothetical protein